MYIISIHAGKCEGCGECIDACPAGILGMVDGKAEVTGAETDCMGCETCVVTCPNEACSLQDCNNRFIKSVCVGLGSGLRMRGYYFKN